MMQPKSTWLVPGGIDALAEVGPRVDQGREELCGGLLLIADVGECELVAVVIQDDEIIVATCVKIACIKGKLPHVDRAIRCLVLEGLRIASQVSGVVRSAVELAFQVGPREILRKLHPLQGLAAHKLRPTSLSALYLLCTGRSPCDSPEGPCA